MRPIAGRLRFQADFDAFGCLCSLRARSIAAMAIVERDPLNEIAQVGVVALGRMGPKCR